jgi:hypothetical protein
MILDQFGYGVEIRFEEAQPLSRPKAVGRSEVRGTSNGTAIKERRDDN